MNYASKILSFENAQSLLQSEKDAGKRIVQCHGTFDLVHPGHIVHFEEARELGDLLVVTVTAAEHVNKGPGRPFFDDELRSKSLAALECIDYVVIIPHPAAIEAIEAVKPHTYCKGKEYADQSNDVTGNISDDVSTVEKHGGEIQYIGSVVFSSTKLINRNFTHISDDTRSFCMELAKRYPPESFREIVESFSKLKILVIGDTIFDKYTYAHIQGLTSKNRILSGRYERDSLQAGGALAIYRHLREFSDHVSFASIVGDETWVEPELSRFVPQANDFIYRDSSYTTIVKQRFVENMKRSQELAKIFSINYINPDYASHKMEETLIERLKDRIKDFDLVLVADFGHGLMTKKLRDFVQTEAPFLALNCQTNSYNHGYNLISHQYSRVDAFTLDEQELMLDREKRNLDPIADLASLTSHLEAKSSWLTRGANGAVGIDRSGQSANCHRLENQVVDTIGAGDAFFSLAAIAAKLQLPIELGTFLGQLAGAQAVKIIGNTESVKKPTLLKGGMGLLNF